MKKTINIGNHRYKLTLSCADCDIYKRGDIELSYIKPCDYNNIRKGYWVAENYDFCEEPNKRYGTPHAALNYLLSRIEKEEVKRRKAFDKYFDSLKPKGIKASSESVFLSLAH